MKHVVSISLLAFLGTAAVFAIPKTSQAITTPQNLFAEQISPTPIPTTPPTTKPKPKPTNPPRFRF